VQGQVPDWRSWEQARKLYLLSMHDMAKPLTRIVATTLQNLYDGQEVAQQAEQKEGNWYCGLQGQLKGDSPKQTKGRVAEAHMALLEDSRCYRIPGAVEAGSSLDFRKVRERLQRVLRPRSNKNHES
jgi:hypothetical protein